MGDWKGGTKKQNYKKRLLHQKQRVQGTPFGNIRGLEHKQNNDYAEAIVKRTISTNHGNMAKDTPVPLLRNPIQGNNNFLFALQVLPMVNIIQFSHALRKYLIIRYF